MIYILLKLGALGLTLLISAMSLIRAQPYDDRQWRDLLLPENCPAPCFLGIRPGDTGVDEAVLLLQQDVRVEHVTSRYDVYLYRPVVNWSWRATPQPETDPHDNGFIYRLEDKTPLVQALRTMPGIALGYINLILGEPTCLTTAAYPFAPDQSYFLLVYQERLLVASAIFDSGYHFDYRTPGNLEYIAPATYSRTGYPASLCRSPAGGYGYPRQ